MQNITRLGRWQLHQEVDLQQAKGPCAARILDDQVDIDGWLGGSPERAAEQVEARRRGGYC